jgi:hypothetical protein
MNESTTSLGGESTEQKGVRKFEEQGGTGGNGMARRAASMQLRVLKYFTPTPPLDAIRMKPCRIAHM